MNIYVALKRDHEVLEKLLNQLVESSEKGDETWKTLIADIRDELVPHSRAEEALFYNQIRKTEHGGKVVLHSYEEHALAETELRALQAMKAIDANFKSVANKLKKDILHHVENEEKNVFAAARQIFSDEEAETIGDAFEALKPKVREQSFVGTSMDLMMNLLPEGVRTRLQGMMSRKGKKAA